MKKQTIALILGLSLISACEPMVENRGHVERVEELSSQVVVGQTTKDDILSAYGSPSSVSTFGDETWYYIAVREERTAFFKPEITDQKVTQITFDSNHVVSDVKHYTGADAQDVQMVSKTTETEGHSLGFMEQVLGNLGRFNTSKRTPSPGRR